MSEHAKRVAFYVRVSTVEQTTDNQRRELAGAAERLGWNVVEVYEDAGISGAKGRDRRPSFDKLLKDVNSGRVDLVAAWSIDRLGRSLQHLLEFLSELHGKGVGLYLHQQGIDTTTPSGRAMYQMMGVFAEFERAMIRERVVAGMARAKAQGKRMGRPLLDADRTAAVRRSIAAGHGIVKTARRVGIGVGTAQRIARESR